MLTGSDMSDLDSETGHVHAALPVMNNTPEFLISAVEQLAYYRVARTIWAIGIGLRGLFEQGFGELGLGLRVLIINSAAVNVFW